MEDFPGKRPDPFETASARVILDNLGPEPDDPTVDVFSGPYAEYLARLVFAALIGGAIGIEREIKGKPAGMRTNILMCMGSCLIMILSIEVAHNTEKIADPGRIAAQVVTGIGFLGAGTIIRSKASVTGLTSAATLWFVAALGLVIGYGDYLLPLAATILMIITLTGLVKLERGLEVRSQLHIIQLNVTSESRNLANVRRVLSEHRVSPNEVELKREAGVAGVPAAFWVDIEYTAPEKKHQSILRAIGQLEGVDILIDY